jgi:hypothetical protein
MKRAAAVLALAVALGGCGSANSAAVRASTSTTRVTTTRVTTTSTRPVTTTTQASPVAAWYKTFASPADDRLINAGSQVVANLQAGSVDTTTACQPFTLAITNADAVPPAPDPTVNGDWQKVLGDYTAFASECLAGNINAMVTSAGAGTKDSVTWLAAVRASP